MCFLLNYEHKCIVRLLLIKMEYLKIDTYNKMYLAFETSMFTLANYFLDIYRDFFLSRY